MMMLTDLVYSFPRAFYITLICGFRLEPWSSSLNYTYSIIGLIYVSFLMNEWMLEVFKIDCRGRNRSGKTFRENVDPYWHKRREIRGEWVSEGEGGRWPKAGAGQVWLPRGYIILFHVSLTYLPCSMLFKTEKHVANLGEDIRDKVEGVGRFWFQRRHYYWFMSYCVYNQY